MKQIIYIGNAEKEIASFPSVAKQRIATALTAVSAGLNLNPTEFKYMPSIGLGVYELRLKVDLQYRVFYVAKLAKAVYVLHAFVKKTQQTPQPNLDLGMTRFKALMAQLKDKQNER
jgi:phage-related protein